jgi:hypothetical protein
VELKLVIIDRGSDASQPRHASRAGVLRGCECTVLQ